MKKEVIILMLVLLPCIFSADNFTGKVTEDVKSDLFILEENKYTFIIFFIIMIAFIVSAVDFTNKRKINKDSQESYLFQQTLETLGKKEQRICKVLNETEGVTEEYLSEKVELKEDVLKDALKKLEKRQVIKERKDSSSKIFLNDWLRED